MKCWKYQVIIVIKKDEINCSTCKKESHYYCQGINENVFSGLTNNTNTKWVCNECKSDWENKKEPTRNLNGKSNDINQLTELVQFVSIKLDQFDITVGKLLSEMNEIKEKKWN